MIYIKGQNQGLISLLPPVLFLIYVLAHSGEGLLFYQLVKGPSSWLVFFPLAQSTLPLLYPGLHAC